MKQSALTALTALTLILLAGSLAALLLLASLSALLATLTGLLLPALVALATLLLLAAALSWFVFVSVHPVTPLVAIKTNSVAAYSFQLCLLTQRADRWIGEPGRMTGLGRTVAGVLATKHTTGSA